MPCAQREREARLDQRALGETACPERLAAALAVESTDPEPVATGLPAPVGKLYSHCLRHMRRMGDAWSLVPTLPLMIGGRLWGLGTGPVVRSAPSARQTIFIGHTSRLSSKNFTLERSLADDF